MLQRIRQTNGRHRWLDRGMIHFAQKGPLWFFLLLGLIALFGGGQARLAVVEAVFAATITRGVNELVGRFYVRERPFVREGFVPLIRHRPSFSFPSNHAACGFALAVAVWLHLPTVGVLLLILAVLLAFSRLFVGVHYPLDVLGGAVIGSVVAKVIVWLGQQMPYLPFF